MSINVLTVVNNAMTNAGLNYEFDVWKSKPAYPYWVGEYQEIEPLYENGLVEGTFLLSGFTRGKRLQLEIEKDRIQKEIFPLAGGRIVTMEDGSVVTIFYAGASVIPTDDDELKRIEVSLTVKEWKVI